MRLSEVLDAKTLATHLDQFSKDKPTRAKTKVKLLRKKANRRSMKTPKNTEHGSWAQQFDHMAGYPSFKDWSVDQANWRTGG